MDDHEEVRSHTSVLGVSSTFTDHVVFLAAHPLSFADTGELRRTVTGTSLSILIVHSS